MHLPSNRRRLHLYPETPNRRRQCDGLDALRGDPGLAAGLNVHQGKVCHAAVAEATGLPFEPYAA